MSTMDIREVLTKLGFTEDWEATTDTLPAYVADMGGVQLVACEVMGRGFRPVMKVIGSVETARTLKRVDVDLPLRVASYEQGVALIAYAVGYDYTSPDAPEWISQGKAWAEHLPWVRKSQSPMIVEPER